MSCAVRANQDRAGPYAHSLDVRVPQERHARSIAPYSLMYFSSSMYSLLVAGTNADTAMTFIVWRPSGELFRSTNAACRRSISARLKRVDTMIDQLGTGLVSNRTG